MAKWFTWSSASPAAASCRLTGSGVVCSSSTVPDGETTPTVPRLAARMPMAVQISRTKLATDVLPLVPVTATIRSGWRPKKRAAALAKARRGLAAAMRTAPSTATPSLTSIALAPAAIACGMNFAPSTDEPGNAANRKPGFTARLSDVRPAMRISPAPSGTCASLFIRRCNEIATRFSLSFSFRASPACRDPRARTPDRRPASARSAR